MPKRMTFTDLQRHKLCIYTYNKPSNSKTKHHRTVTYSELDLALKKFMLIYQYRTVLTNALLVEKAKSLANGLKNLQKLQEEAAFVDIVAINNIMLSIKDRLKPDHILATQQLSEYKKIRNASQLYCVQILMVLSK
ncbi:23763_t:CDS:2 [Dentiscutata erythropus]|uniref:23763_t:CDS:1 n=1 Tax=Dentiscutata erythropus TaxID=1348616 RepID=A0A9N9CIG6_9GLOM|nr:23763_t:CDS:2 [Dentiscutata erythropus]